MPYYDDAPKRASTGDGPGPVKVVALLVGVIFVLWLIIFVISWAGSRAAPQAGQIGVVRSGPATSWVGAWFNGHGIRSVVAPGSGSTYIGLGSSVHWYPDDSVQRNYTISSTPGQGDEPGVDYVQVPTSDGIEVSLEGTFYFKTAFNAGKGGEALLRDFDNRFGVRTFAVDAAATKQLYPWQGTDGWEAFLNTVIRPIIDNDLRKAVADVTCAQLVSSCALVHEQTTAVTGGGSTNNQSIQKIQNAINGSLESDVASTLGSDYFSNIQSSIQAQIEHAQAQFAAVGTAQAQVQQAQLQAKANREKDRLQLIDRRACRTRAVTSFPPNVTTFAPGAGFAITAK